MSDVSKQPPSFMQVSCQCGLEMLKIMAAMSVAGLAIFAIYCAAPYIWKSWQWLMNALSFQGNGLWVSVLLCGAGVLIQCWAFCVHTKLLAIALDARAEIRRCDLKAIKIVWLVGLVVLVVSVCAVWNNLNGSIPLSIVEVGFAKYILVSSGILYPFCWWVASGYCEEWTQR